jgi:signal transduction histidine kinase
MLSRRVQDRPEAIDLIDRIQIAQRQLLKLYEQVREYATPIMLERSPSDLNDILKLAWDHLESEKQDKNIQLNLRTGDLDVACYIDPFAMEQVFRNVLENGISACGTHGVITVSWIDTTIQSVPAIRISISNDGPPLVLEEQERIFEAFFTKKTRGSGLGMAITKRLVEAHGGLVEVSQPDKGVEILITLPRGLT